VAPVVAFAVEPGHLHTGGQRAHAVGVRVVADVQHLVRRNACSLGSCHKNAQVRLGHAQRLGAHAGVKVVANAHAVHVGIAIRQRHHRVALAPEGQRGQRVIKQIDPLALGKKDFKSRLGQLARITRLQQQSTDGLQPQKRQVVRPVGMAGVDLGAHGFFDLGLRRQDRRGGRVLRQPIGQHRFGAVDGGPDGPQGVVQIEGNGADAGEVKHGEGEYRMAFNKEPSFQHGQAARTAILYCNLGTPSEPTAPALRTYLAEFLGDSRVVEIPKPIWWLILHGIILRVRPKKSAAKYASIWTKGGSPLKVFTEQQAQSLGTALQERGHSVTVRYAMRYGQPSIPAQLSALKAEGVQRVLIVPAYPQYSGTTTASVFDAVYRWCLKTRLIPEMRFVNRYHDDPRYIAALAQTVREHWAAHGQAEKLVMSFHGVPERTLHLGDPYHCECMKTGRLLAEALGLAKDQYKLTFQSRFGKAKWLEPYTEPTLIAMAQQGVKKVDVICPGFTSDCLETLEEIQQEAKEAFLHAGGESFSYIPCLNNHAQWIEALADISLGQMQGWDLSAPDEAALAASRARALAHGARI